MSFAINPSLSYIDVPEETVQEIYRSTTSIQLNDSGFRGHPCEAYICLCKDEHEIRAYVALFETVMKSVFVYSSELTGKIQSDYPLVAAEAQDYVKNLGFTMERVNLDFSKAMREVIIKGIRVMRPPVKKHVARSLAPNIKSVTSPQIDLASDAIVVTPQSKPGEAAAEISSLKAELSSAKSAIEKITRNKVTLEAAAAKEIASLKNAATRAAEALQAAEERCKAELESLRSENLALRTPTEDLEKTALQRTVEEAAAKQAELQKLLEEQEHQLAESEFGRQSLAQLLTAESAEIAKLKNENKLLAANLAAEQATNATAMEKITSLALFESSWKDGQLREEELCKNLDLLQAQLDKLQAELAASAAEKQAAEGLRARITELEAALATAATAAADSNVAPVLTEQTAAEIKALTEAKNDVEHEYIRLANESREKEEELLEALYAADDTILRLQRDLEISTKVAAAEQEALRAEMKQMITGGAVKTAMPNEPDKVTALPVEVTETAVVKPAAAKPEPEPVSSPVQVDTPPVVQPATKDMPQTAAEVHEVEEQFDDDLAAPMVRDLELTSGLTNEFGSFSSSLASATEFSPAPELDGIIYARPEEVVALLYSSNSVQAMPDGKKSERCKAFAVALNSSGAYSVYIAWQMTDSKKTVVCTPDHQPVNVADCTAILQDAVAYFEIVGFMMELEDLGETVGSCIKALKRVPALKRIKNPS